MFLTCETIDLGCHLCVVEETYDCALFTCPLQSLAISKTVCTLALKQSTPRRNIGHLYAECLSYRI